MSDFILRAFMWNNWNFHFSSISWLWVRVSTGIYPSLLYVPPLFIPLRHMSYKLISVLIKILLAYSNLYGEFFSILQTCHHTCIHHILLVAIHLDSQSVIALLLIFLYWLHRSSSMFQRVYLLPITLLYRSLRFPSAIGLTLHLSCSEVASACSSS